jgi:hypothetical protein
MYTKAACGEVVVSQRRTERQGYLEVGWKEMTVHSNKFHLLQTQVYHKHTNESGCCMIL